MELSKVGGFGGGLPRKCINVHQNGDFDHGRVLYVQSEWDMDALLNAVSLRLEIVPSARRLFNSDGIEIEDVLMIEDGAIVFVSSGTDFIVPSMNKRHGHDDDHHGGGATGQSSGRRGSGDHAGSKATSASKSIGNIPPVVGGYIVGDLLGRGGFGEVRLGVHQLTQEKVAMKFMHKSAIIASMGAAERATTEIQCLMALNHPNVIRLVQQFETPKYMVMAFELMEGGDLFRYLSSSGGMNEDEARNVFHQIVSAVSYAHNHHICHRDLKLENVLLCKEGSLQVKIADFGLSDFYPPGATRRSQCGSFSYLAPEVFKGTSNAGPPIDVWALGVMLFAMLCGRLPFEATAFKSNTRNSNRKQQQAPQPSSDADDETIIRNRILKCQYKIDEGLTPEAKDMVRRMLKLDPSERASIPEITTHCWLRMRHSTMFDVAGGGTGSKQQQPQHHSGHHHAHSGHHHLLQPDHHHGGDATSPPTVTSHKLSTTGPRHHPTNSTTTPSVSPPLLPPTSPLGRTARTSPAALSPPPLSDGAATLRDTLTLTPPPFSTSPTLDGILSSSPLRVPSLILSDGPSTARGGSIAPLSGTARMRETGGATQPSNNNAAVTIMFDAPLLTSPLHSKRSKEAAVSLLSFLDGADSKDDGSGSSDSKGQSSMAAGQGGGGLGKSGLTGKTLSLGRMIEPSGLSAIDTSPLISSRMEKGASTMSPPASKTSSSSSSSSSKNSMAASTSSLGRPPGSGRGGGGSGNNGGGVSVPPRPLGTARGVASPRGVADAKEARDGERLFIDATAPPQGGDDGDAKAPLSPMAALRGVGPTAVGGQSTAKGEGGDRWGGSTANTAPPGDKRAVTLNKLDREYLSSTAALDDPPTSLLHDSDLGSNGGGKKLTPMGGTSGTPSHSRRSGGN